MKAFYDTEDVLNYNPFENEDDILSKKLDQSMDLESNASEICEEGCQSDMLPSERARLNDITRYYS